MTLVVGIARRDSIWMLADRRISYCGTRPPKDDACKLMFLDATDGVAILGYAGLGSTALGTEPAEWMSAVLRGRKLPLEQSLSVLARAMQEYLPIHVAALPGAGRSVHQTVAVAFVAGKPRVYSIDLVVSADRKKFRFRHKRYVIDRPPAPQRSPWLIVTGSGQDQLENEERIRPLLQIVRATDRGLVNPRIMADQLAKLNHVVQQHLASVGPRCIVAWRFRRGSLHTAGGGQAHYTRSKRDLDSPALPAIAHGMDMRALLGAMLPHVVPNLMATLARKPVSEQSKREEERAVQAAVAMLPDGPDEQMH